MSREKEELDSLLEEKTHEKIKEPSLYKVILLNDDYTTMDFVVQILINVFHKTKEEATTIMLSVHRKGAGLCGVYAKEIAETKVAIVEEIAQQHEFPLKCTMEEA
jgi:ATP-dependent Clp protease adaptor protein ClpS